MRKMDLLPACVAAIILLMVLMGMALSYEDDMADSFDNGNYNAQNAITGSCKELKSFYIERESGIEAYECRLMKRPELR